MTALLGGMLLGGMTPAAFLKKHWQKKPLLIRQAVPHFAGLVDVDELFAIANEPGAVARVVVEERKRFQLYEASAIDPAKLPATRWTLLVQGAEGFVHGGWELLRQFSFIPAARVDDLMISYAAPGGSVGPHEDQYDVFLLQGPGRRRWQTQTGGTRTFDEAAPVKVLTDFAPDAEWVLEPGDMLYLPPGVAHWGVAVDSCFTYSIGFLAPTNESLVHNWLHYLEQTVDASVLDGLYEDPKLMVPDDPIVLGDDMVKYVDKLVKSIGGDVEEFLGRLLTGPKPNVVFQPRRALSFTKFAERLRRPGTLSLAKKSRGLVRGNRVFINGEARVCEARAVSLLADLLRDRFVTLPLPRAVGDDVIAWLRELYGAGYLVFER